MNTTTSATVWPVLIYDDARAAITFLTEAFGFSGTAVYPDDEDDSRSCMPSWAGPAAGSCSARPAPAANPSPPWPAVPS